MQHVVARWSGRWPGPGTFPCAGIAATGSCRWPTTTTGCATRPTPRPATPDTPATSTPAGCCAPTRRRPSPACSATAHTGEVLLSVPGICYRRDVIDRHHVGEPHQIDLWRVRPSGPALTGDDLLQMVGLVVDSVLPGCPWRCRAGRPSLHRGRSRDIRRARGSRGRDRRVRPGPPGAAGGRWTAPGRVGPGDGPRPGPAHHAGQGHRRHPPAAQPRIRGSGHRCSTSRRTGRCRRCRRPGATFRWWSRPTSTPNCWATGCERRSARTPPRWRRWWCWRRPATTTCRPPLVRAPACDPTRSNVLLRLVIRDLDHTLTAAEANERRDRVYAALHEGDRAEWAVWPAPGGPMHLGSKWRRAERPRDRAAPSDARRTGY